MRSKILGLCSSNHDTELQLTMLFFHTFSNNMHVPSVEHMRKISPAFIKKKKKVTFLNKISSYFFHFGNNVAISN